MHSELGSIRVDERAVTPVAAALVQKAVSLLDEAIFEGEDELGQASYELASRLGVTDEHPAPRAPALGLRPRGWLRAVKDAAGKLESLDAPHHSRMQS